MTGPQQNRVIEERSCRICGSLFFGFRSVEICSDVCRREVIKAGKDRYDAKRRESVISSRAPRICAECVQLFRALDGRQIYCSRKCKRRVEQRKQDEKWRAREAGVKYEPINRTKIFDRDGWTCRICDAPTPRALRGTQALNAPEMDHIKPLSEGGSHTHSNVQCLCHGCNFVKESIDRIFRPFLATSANF
jgi:5-methylcytosine-specific restriction endonuclease McrA